MPESGRPDLSIAIPVYNEEGSLPTLIARIEEVLDETGLQAEVLFVDDGSTDGSLEIIRKMRERNPAIHYIQFDGNRGKSAALDAAFRRVRGEVVVIMDADCQNEPRDIPKFLEAMSDADIVCGIRVQRLDQAHRRIQSRLANRIRNWVTKDGVQDSGCGYQAIRTSFLPRIKMFRGMHRFLPCLLQLEGARMAQIPIGHLPRHAGESKYRSVGRAISATLDLLAVRWMIARHVSWKIQKEE